jgi:hypothetical protein
MSVNDVVQLITAVGVLITALTGLHNGRKIGAVTDHVETVHKAVNSTAQEQNARVEQLAGALNDANLQVPERPPKEEPPA